MRRFRVTRDAESDLDEIWLHIARDNVDAANDLVEALTTRFPLIAATPQMGRARDELKAGLRSHAVGRYVIYYRQAPGRVSILHVVHGSRDPKRVFKT